MSSSRPSAVLARLLAMCPPRLRYATLVSVCIFALLCIPQTVTADDQAAIRALAGALADEQARITELKAELERRTAALTDLARRLQEIAPPPLEPPIALPIVP